MYPTQGWADSCAQVALWSGATCTTSSITARIANLSSSLTNRETGHFSDERHAFLFKPGTYSADVKVGYYMQVAGLGKNADDVVFQGDHSVQTRADPQWWLQAREVCTVRRWTRGHPALAPSTPSGGQLRISNRSIPCCGRFRKQLQYDE